MALLWNVLVEFLGIEYYNYAHASRSLLFWLAFIQVHVPMVPDLVRGQSYDYYYYYHSSVREAAQTLVQMAPNGRQIIIWTNGEKSIYVNQSQDSINSWIQKPSKTKHIRTVHFMWWYICASFPAVWALTFIRLTQYISYLNSSESIALGWLPEYKHRWNSPHSKLIDLKKASSE